MVTLLLAVALASANDATPSWLYEAIQGEGQDVVVTLALVKGGEPGLGAVYDLDRDGEALFSGRSFLEAETDVMERRCRGGAEWDCTDTPESCEDCDGDGTPECNLDEDGWCEEVLYYEVDDCAPVGLATWTLTAEGWAGYSSTTDLEVEDRGGECNPPAEIGCATGPAGGGLLALCMVGIGLGALGAGRRRRVSTRTWKSREASMDAGPAPFSAPCRRCPPPLRARRSSRPPT